MFSQSAQTQLSPVVCPHRSQVHPPQVDLYLHLRSGHRKRMKKVSTGAVKLRGILIFQVDSRNIYVKPSVFHEKKSGFRWCSASFAANPVFEAIN